MPQVSGCWSSAPHTCSHPNSTLALDLATETQAPRQVPRNPSAQSSGAQPRDLLLPSDSAKSQGTPHCHTYFYLFIHWQWPVPARFRVWQSLLKRERVQGARSAAAPTLGTATECQGPTPLLTPFLLALFLLRTPRQRPAPAGKKSPPPPLTNAPLIGGLRPASAQSPASAVAMATVDAARPGPPWPPTAPGCWWATGTRRRSWRR